MPTDRKSTRLNSSHTVISTLSLHDALPICVESMTRAPFVLSKADSAFSRAMNLQDTTLGWRFVNPRLSALYHPYSMGETAENVAERTRISRAEQDAYRSEEHTSELQSHSDLHSFPTRRSSDLCREHDSRAIRAQQG